MTVSFADYVASQEQRENVSDEIVKYTHSLIEALKDNYRQYSIRGHQYRLNDDPEYHQQRIDELRSGECPIDYYVETGRKYHKVVMIDSRGSKSVHCFIDKNTGGVFKSATWKAPAKGERFNLLVSSNREWLFENADWSGGYLYKR